MMSYCFRPSFPFIDANAKKMCAIFRIGLLQYNTYASTNIRRKIHYTRKDLVLVYSFVCLNKDWKICILGY